MQQTKQLSGPEKFFDLSRNGPQEIILLILTTFCLDYNYIDIVWRNYSLRVKQITGASTISIYLTVIPQV